MTGPEDSQADSRPISVAELLAKNGTIGAPPVGGRRRRRRGNADSVTVAELTGEIPVISDDLPADTGEKDEKDDKTPPQPVRPAQPVPSVSAAVPVRTPEVAEPTETPDVPVPDQAAKGANGNTANGNTVDIEADYEAHLRAREADPEPVEFKPRRTTYPGAVRSFQPSGTGAERMIPDPLDDDDDDDVDSDGEDAHDGGGSFGGSAVGTIGPLFGGHSVADDLARRDSRPGPDDSDLEDDRRDDVLSDSSEDDFDAPDDGPDEQAQRTDSGSPLVHGVWVFAQCVVAFAFGAGLFLAFYQLWRWNMIVAVILGVLVIIGLAGGVRVVRKTEDIGSTLTAVGVGALVTFGPLLLQAS